MVMRAPAQESVSPPDLVCEAVISPSGSLRRVSKKKRPGASRRPGSTSFTSVLAWMVNIPSEAVSSRQFSRTSISTPSSTGWDGRTESARVTMDNRFRMVSVLAMNFIVHSSRSDVVYNYSIYILFVVVVALWKLGKSP